MFRLYTSNSVERLIARLATVIAESQPLSLFTPQTFLVQNRGMERLISQELAQYFGVWCNGTCLLPDQFVDDLCNELVVDNNTVVYDRDVLVWRLERVLRDLSGPVSQLLRLYLGGERQELRRYQLASRLADVFERYQIMRPDMLAAWARGELVCSDPAEAWQRQLWQSVCAEIPEAAHRGAVIASLIAQLRNNPGRPLQRIGRLFVVGMHTIPPLFLQLLDALAKRVEVHYFLLSPCRQYWGDIETRRNRLSRRVGSLGGPGADEIVGGLYHPLLASLGRQGADFQELLYDTVEQIDDVDDFVDPMVAGEPSVLHHLQADLLDGTEPPQASFEENRAGDTSLVAVSCHSRRREIEVLKDFIISRLQEDRTLRLHDLVVMSPDIEQYAPLIPAFFHDIPHDIGDCRNRHENRWLDGFLLFLQLFGSRYSWSELLGVLERPEIYPHFELTAADLELVRHWVLTAGIRWGLSVDQRQEDGLFPFPSATWRAGLERMLMGLAVDSEHPVDGITPFSDIEVGQGVLLGGLWCFVDLVERTRHLIGEPASLAVWSRRLHDWCSALFGVDDQPELMEVLRLIDTLEQRYAPYHQEQVAGEVVCAWLAAMAEGRSSTGLLSGRLTFCSLQPMRPVPFRVVCLLGLNDGDFPREDRHYSFDLTGKQYRKGDRSRRSDDRYQFLETIMIARDSLYLSYIGQSVRTNKNVAPSVVVSELLETVAQYYGVTGLVRQHPLQPYSPAYFSDRGDFFSYDQEQCQLAKILADSPVHRRGRWLEQPLSISPPDRVDLTELTSFITRPQRYLLRTIFGIRLDGAEDLPEEEEPFSLTGLDRYLSENALTEGLLRGQPAASVLRSLQDRLAWPLGEPGRLLFAERLTVIASFVRQVQALGADEPAVPTAFEVEIDGMVISGQLDCCYRDCLLFYRFSRLRGSDILTAWLHHLVAPHILGRSVTTRIIGSDEVMTICPTYGTIADLSYLLELFREGCRYPSSLLVEPALAYARQVLNNRGRGRKTPIDAARSVFREQVERDYAPEYRFLYRDAALEQILDDSFVSCSERLFVPLLEQILTESGGGADA